ncbi:EAL and GGDEF domain-containing protein [Noviherbaspirillum denitrificans]|uniref:Diguanylate cyclase n=1 Tax=Noviherbaspirillum denitrificans TaxID=1968433 RepID=A0A254TQ21_9BURK|nr:EAL domain-containing protein [Noviherbaspirillum denitrificans]OWW21828.1 hypothetical protein AYR66_22365 [Noviherbaspirillum denitrificans]
MKDDLIHSAATIDGPVPEHQALLQAVFAIETVGVLFFNLDGQIVNANPAFERMCGYTRDELCTTAHWEQLTDPEFFAVTYEVAERLATEGRTPPYEKMMIRKDGTRWWGLFAPTRLSGSGLESRCAEFILDITERKNAETALGESEERFRSLVQGFAQAVWETDIDGVVVTDSPSWRAFTGQTIKEWMGRGWINAVHPDDREYALRQWDDAVRSRRGANAEFRLKSARDNDWRWTNVRAAPIFDSNGSLRKWVGINIDVDDQRRMQEALRAAAVRDAFRVRLADVLHPLDEPIAIQEEAARMLGRHLCVARALYVEVEPDKEHVLVQRDFAEGVGSQVGRHKISDFGAFLLEAFRAGHTIVVRDSSSDPRLGKAEQAAYDAVSVRAFVGVPLIKNGKFVSALTVNHPGARTWTADEIALIEEVAELTWAAVERARANQARRASEERLRALFDSMTEAFAIMEAIPADAETSVDYRFLETNPAFDRHIRLHAPREHTLQELLPDIEPYWLERFEQVLHTGAPTQFEAYIASHYRWFAISATRLGNDNGLRLAVVFTDITERKLAEEKIRHASLHDALTGLPNRTMLFEYASHLLPHNRRTNQCAAVLFLDLDRFKPINDSHGHMTGDLVLKEIARRLVMGAREEDIVVRLGGDEFVILLQDLKDAAAAAEVAIHILDRINQPYHIGELSLSLSTSIGISLFPGDGQDIDTLISQADMAMYQAKQAGSNNFQFYSPEYSAETRLQRVIEQQLKSALRNSTFHLCYQPVLDVETGRIVSVEALLRCHETNIGPDRFIPIAETTGIINPIGRWLLAEAARQHKAWLDHGLPLIPIAVNVSVVEFRDRDFPNRFEDTVSEHGIETNALQLEVTETAVMDDVEHAIAMLSRLQALGVKILLDDFGTGHSSLAYLARLPLNKVKIDKSFVTPLDKDKTSRVVTNAMIALSRTLGLEVVAEGVETEGALEYIRTHGCTQAQGYYLGQPMSGADFEHWYWEKGQHLQNTGDLNCNVRH